MVYNKKDMRKQDAFTLMEVMLAVVVIGILATLALPGIMRMRRRLQKNTTLATMATLETAIRDYQEDIGHFPTRQEGGLEAIVTRPRGKAAEKWDGPYLKGRTELPQDSWNYDFEYNTGPAIKDKARFKYFEIISTGPNGPDDESDDLSMGE